MQAVSILEPAAWLNAIWQHARVLRMSRPELEAQQTRKFRKLVALAFERSPFYRSIIQDRGLDVARCRPTDFPVLTKQLVAENFDRIVTDPRLTKARIAQFLDQSHDPGEFLDGQYHVLHSSGTSGSVGLTVFSHQAWMKGASQMLHVLPLRWRTRVAFVAAVRGHFAGASLLVTGNHSTNRFFFNVQTFDVSQPSSDTIGALNKFQPKGLTGYAGILKQLAEAQLAGELRIHPSVVVSGAEPLRPQCRNLLQRAFGAPVVNAYASSEHLFMALTLPGSDGMFLLEDDLIFELHDDFTCVTNLFNDALPLIRYRMDDLLRPEPDPTARYPFVRIRDVVGRSEDMAVFLNRDGVEDGIHPSLIGELLVPGLNSWQLQLIDQTAFVFRARFDPGRSREQKQAIRIEVRQRLSAILAEKRLDNVRFEIEEIDHLRPDPVTGKTRMILKPQPNARPRDRRGAGTPRPVLSESLNG